MKPSAGAAVAFACLAIPAAAGAHLPRAHSTVIIPGVGMGGVRLDMTKAQVTGKWGAADKCFGGSSCEWDGPGTPGKNEVATVSFAQNGRVNQISIRSASRGKNLLFKPGTLSNWATRKGIHLGSPKKKVPQAYGGGPGILRANNSTGVNGFDYFLGVGPNRSTGPNTTNTRFGTPGVGASAKLLWGITISWACPRPTGACAPIPQ